MGGNTIVFSPCGAASRPPVGENIFALGVFKVGAPSPGSVSPAWGAPTLTNPRAKILSPTGGREAAPQGEKTIEFPPTRPNAPCLLCHSVTLQTNARPGSLPLLLVALMPRQRRDLRNRPTAGRQATPPPDAQAPTSRGRQTTKPDTPSQNADDARRRPEAKPTREAKQRSTSTRTGPAKRPEEPTTQTQGPNQRRDGRSMVREITQTCFSWERSGSRTVRNLIPHLCHEVGQGAGRNVMGPDTCGVPQGGSAGSGWACLTAAASERAASLSRRRWAGAHCLHVTKCHGGASWPRMPVDS